MVDQSPRNRRVAVKAPSRGTRHRTVSVEASVLDELRGQLEALSKSQAMIELDLNGTICSANENFLKLFGYAHHELVGKSHSVLLAPDYAGSAEYRSFWGKLCGGA